MKLWKISQEKNCNYDTYDSAIVAAETEDEAKKTKVGDIGLYGTWCKPEFVKVEYIGEAKKGTKAGVILDSFNAG